MSLEKFSTDLAVIQKLGTFPNQDQDLTADELKAKFDEAALLIQDYINNVMIPEINTLGGNTAENSIVLEELNRFVADLQVTVNSVSASNKVTVDQVAALEALVKTFDSRIKNCVKTVNGISPDENGNVSVAGGSAEPMKYLQIDRRKLQGYDLLALYNGTEFKQAEIPMGFTCIEPSEYNGQSNILRHHLSNMPAMLNGTFKATEQSEEEYQFRFAYAFSGGYTDFEPTSCMVLEPESGKIWHFDFADGSVKTTTIGENGGSADGGQWELIGDITTEEEVSTIEISVGAEYKEIYIQAEAKSTVGGKVQTIDIADTTKLVQSTNFFPSNNVGTVVVHLKLADGFAFGEFSCVKVNAEGNYATFNDANHRTFIVKTKELSNGFEKVKFAVAETTYQVGAKLIVWGCK